MGRSDGWLDSCSCPEGRGCLGIQLSCGHSFSCVSDPEFGKHRCGAGWTPVLWSLLMAIAAFVVTWSLADRL